MSPRPLSPGQTVRLLLGPVVQLLLRRATARWRALPEVFLVGAVKAGTTSLAAYLERHPAYVPAFTKELLFLQDLPGLAGNEAIHPLLGRAWGRFQPGNLAPYRKFFPLRATLTRRARAAGGRALTGDHTPFSLYCPTAVRRIREIQPQARILLLLRNPVDRAWADYHMHRARNPQEHDDFARAVEDELAGRTTDFRRRYLHKSTYAAAVGRYLEAFPRDQVRVLRSEDFFDPARTGELLDQTFRFLGLEPLPMAEFPVHNRGRYTQAPPPELRQRLEDHFRPDGEALRQLLGDSFRW